MRKIVFLAFLGDVFTLLYGSCVSDGLLRGLVLALFLIVEFLGV